MATTLFITPAELTETTILGGNVDIDKYTFCIADVQISVIEPLLGTELYDKIYTDFTADTLAGDYSTIFTEFVKPITKHEAIAQYIEIASYRLQNSGLFKHQPEDAIPVEQDEARQLAEKYHNHAQMYVKRFYKWICKNDVTEYKTYQDEVNAQKNVTLRSGWFLGGNVERDDDDIIFVN